MSAALLIALWLACAVATFYLLANEQRENCDVHLSDAILIGLIAAFGPFGLVAGFAVIAAMRPPHKKKPPIVIWRKKRTKP